MLVSVFSIKDLPSLRKIMHSPLQNCYPQEEFGRVNQNDGTTTKAFWVQMKCKILCGSSTYGNFVSSLSSGKFVLTRLTCDWGFPWSIFVMNNQILQIKSKYHITSQRLEEDLQHAYSIDGRTWDWRCDSSWFELRYG